jgi:tRNA (guanine37-N1)-methyltransferase
LGGFVHSGGEIAAAAIVDATVRLLPGVLGNSESLVGESFEEEGSVGPPQYTRPAVWRDAAVPDVLLSGNHERVRAWREDEARKRALRPAAGVHASEEQP